MKIKKYITTLISLLYIDFFIKSEGVSVITDLSKTAPTEDKPTPEPLEKGVGTNFYHPIDTTTAAVEKFFHELGIRTFKIPQEILNSLIQKTHPDIITYIVTTRFFKIDMDDFSKFREELSLFSSQRPVPTVDSQKESDTNTGSQPLLFKKTSQATPTTQKTQVHIPVNLLTLILGGFGGFYLNTILRARAVSTIKDNKDPHQLSCICRELLEKLPQTTEKFCKISPIPLLSTLAVTEPWSVPYCEEQHGKSLEAFQQYPDQFAVFREQYYELVDQVLFLAINLELSAAGLQTLEGQLSSFKEHLFDPGYCDARPNVLWNSAREHLEVLVVLLQQPTLSTEKRLDVINNLGFNLLLCSEGVVSYLQDSIQTLVSDGNIIPRAKEILVQQLVIQFVQDNHLCVLGMQVHYVNAFINYFADDLGLNQRPYEQTVATDNASIQQHVATCWQTLTEKLPGALVSYLSDELCSAGRQALQDGQLEGESWQQFSNSPIAEFLKSGVIKHALFVEDEQSGRFAVPTNSHSLHWLVARYLMDQGWLQPQENRHLMARDDGGALYTLSNYWFWWQSKEDREHQRPLTAEELLELFAQVTQSPSDQAAQLPRIALRLLDLAAEQGSAEAAIELVINYQKGQIAKNERPAPRHYRLAADQGNAEAQYNLGVMYEQGQGVAPNQQEACRLFQLAANQGDAQAQYILGVRYANGQGVAPNQQEACRLFQLAADQGDAQAQYILGVRYANGQDVTKDEQEACRLFQLAADQGCARAQYNLGVRYANGQGVTEDEQEACRLFQLAADQGNALAQYNLGVRYANGQGVAPNQQEACRLFQLAADQGCARAQCYLGEMYEQGRGVGKSEQEAVRLYQLAAEQGHAQAQVNLELLRNTALDHAALAEAVVSFNEQQQPLPGVTIDQGGFADSIPILPSFDEHIERPR